MTDQEIRIINKYKQMKSTNQHLDPAELTIIFMKTLRDIREITQSKHIKNLCTETIQEFQKILEIK